MAELKLNSFFDEADVEEQNELVIPDESDVPYLTRAESDAEYDRNKNRTAFQSAAAFVDAFDFTGYAKETWLPALTNESILKGLISGDKSAYKAVGRAAELGTRDLGRLGKMIIEQSLESDDLTEDQKKANHHARQNEMLTYQYAARPAFIEQAADGKYKEDINALADVLDVTVALPSAGIFVKGYTGAIRKGIKGAAKAAIPVTKGMTKAADITNKVFKIPEKVAGSNVMTFANAIGASAWALGDSANLLVGTAAFTVGKMASNFATKAGRNLAEVQKVFSKPSSHERFLFRLSTNPDVSPKIRKLATRAIKMHGTKMYDVAFDALVAGTSAGALQAALQYASGASDEQAGNAFSTGMAMGGPMGAAFGPRGSGKNTASTAGGKLTARSQKSIQEYMARKNSNYAAKDIAELARVSPDSAVNLATIDALAPIEGLRVQILDMNELAGHLSKETGTKISKDEVPQAHYDRDMGVMILNADDMVASVREATHIFAHELGHHFMKQRLGLDISTRRQVLESFEDPEGKEFHFLNDKGNRIETIQPIKLNAEAQAFAQAYSDRVRKTSPQLADRILKDASVLAEELGADMFATAFGDNPNAFEMFQPEFRAGILGGMRTALSKFGLVDAKSGAANAIMPDLKVPKALKNMYKNYMEESRNLQSERADAVDTGKKVFPKKGDTAQASFQKQKGGLTWDKLAGNDFLLKDQQMFDEFADVMNRVTQDLDKKYVGLGRDASNQNMHPEIREFIKKHSLRPDSVDAILNLAQDLIDSRETVQIGHRTGKQNEWSDYNPYLISDVTLFGFQFSPKAPSKRKNRKTGETKVQYPAMKVMAYKNEVVESNIMAMAQAGLLKDYGNDPQAFARALTEHSKTAFRKYGPEAQINPEGKGENELFAMAFGSTTLKADSLKQPMNKQFWSKEGNGIKNGIKSYYIGELIGAARTGTTGFAVDYYNMRDNFLPSASRGTNYDASKADMLESAIVVAAGKSNKRPRIEGLQQAAKDLRAGLIDQSQYADLVDENLPVGPLTKQDIIPETLERISEAITRQGNDKKISKINQRDQLKTGDKASLRLDIPSYDGPLKAWVPTIYVNKKTVSHQSTAVVTNAAFGNPHKSALRVAEGGAKGPFAVIDGSYKNMSEQAAVNLATRALENKDGTWTQVGFDPERHSYFYDRGDHRIAVESADMVVQVGRSVFAKNAKKELAGKTFGKDGFFMPAKKGTTDTKAFKNWFGNSKVVDDNGNPLVVYHGTETQFNTFNDGRSLGPHFGNIDQANDIVSGKKNTNIMPVYLSIKNPLRLMDAGNDDANSFIMQLSDVLDRREVDRLYKLAPDSEAIEIKYGSGSKFDEVYRDTNRRALLEVKKSLISEGYDGVVYRNEHEGKQSKLGADSYIAFSPEQIKSATGNKGTFDSGNPDIRYMPAKQGDGVKLPVLKKGSGWLFPNGGFLESDYASHEQALARFMDEFPESDRYKNKIVGSKERTMTLKGLDAGLMRVKRDGKFVYFQGNLTPAMKGLIEQAGIEYDFTAIHDGSSKGSRENTSLIYAPPRGNFMPQKRDWEGPSLPPRKIKAAARKDGMQASIGVAALREQTLSSLPFAQRMAKQAYFKRFMSQNKKILNQLGIVVEDAYQTIGGWEDTELNSIARENSQRINVKFERPEDLETAVALLGSLAPEIQNSVMTVEYSTRGKQREYVLDIDPQKAEELTSLETLSNYNLQGGFTYDNETNKLIFATDSKSAAESVERFIDDYNGQGIKSGTFRKAKVNWPISKGYRQSLALDRIHRLYGGDDWKNLHQLADEARQRLSYNPKKAAQKVLRGKAKAKASKTHYKKEGKIISTHDSLIVEPNVIAKDKNYVTKKLETMSERGWNQLLEANYLADSLQSQMDDGGTGPENWAKINTLRTQKDIPTEIAIPPATLHRWITEEGSFQKFFSDKVKEDPEYLQSALDGLASVMPNHDMAKQGKIPTIMTALHAMWGVMSISAAPVAQESGWIQLVNDKDTLNYLYDSIDGTFDLSLDDWELHVSKFLKSVKDGGIMADVLDKKGRPVLGKDGKPKKRPFAGNSVTMNANSMHKVLKEFNGRWDQLNGIINNGDLTGSQMRDEFFKQGFGGAYLGNKILSFVLATVARDDLVIIDRWQLINLWSDYLDKKSDGRPFRYEKDGTPVEKTNFYDTYVNLLSGTEGLAVFKSIEVAMNKLIEKNQQFLTEQLSSHGLEPSIFALHWITWNMIKKEAVGHSSLDVTQKYLLEKRYPNDILQRQKFIEDFTGETKSTEEVVRKIGGGRERYKHTVEKGKNPYIQIQR